MTIDTGLSEIHFIVVHAYANSDNYATAIYCNIPVTSVWRTSDSWIRTVPLNSFYRGSRSSQGGQIGDYPFTIGGGVDTSGLGIISINGGRIVIRGFNSTAYNSGVTQLKWYVG